MSREGAAAESSAGQRPPLEESAEELYEDAPVGYLSTADDGTILRCNRTFLKLSGYSADELVGRRRFYDLLPPGAKIYYETHYAPLLEMQRAVREIALELVRADGERLPVLVNARVNRSADGSSSSVRITVLDATDRRRYEQELLHARSVAESRAAAASALEHVKEAVVLLDQDGRIVVLNAAASRLLAVSGEDVTGLPLSSLARGWTEIVERIPVGRGAEPVDSVVVPLAAGGGTLWVAASGAAAPDGTVYTLRDVTAERRLEDLRDDIVAIVSHELRTPLAGVYGAARTLSSRGDTLTEEERSSLVEMLVEQTGRLARVLDEILVTQRIDEGGLSAERTPFRVAPVVEGVIERSRGWRNAPTVELVESEDVEADADPELLRQVLVNLLDNAAKYSPAGGTVRVAIRRRRSSVRVTVADEGPGVAPEDRERIFEKFFRVDPSQTTGGMGVGLGLYIARELARRMRGQVGLLETDAGSTFYVDLPLA